MTRPATIRDDDTPRKATLFCWGCDHSSPIEGDWIRRTRDRHVEYVCPDCETTLAKRPRRGSSERRGETTRPSAAAWRTVRTAVHVWRASVDVGLSSITAMTAYGPLGNVTRQ